MMNKTKIEWSDFSWNPITGCRRGCPYCYAAKQAKRFSGDVRINLASEQIRRDGDMLILDAPFKGERGQVIPRPTGFEPTFHRYRLPMPAQKKKPARIFVCSVADMFGDWVPDSIIEEVFQACKDAPQHTYLFLTKYPERYVVLAQRGALPALDNFWYGTTVTTPETMFFFRDQLNTFVSVEPIHAPFANLGGENGFETKTDWIIIGQETGQRIGRVKPAKDWIEPLVNAAREAGTPVFLKNNLAKTWGDGLMQNYPDSLRDELFTFPTCRECTHCDAVEWGKDKTHFKCTHPGAPQRGPEGGADPALIGIPQKRRPLLHPSLRFSPKWCPRRA